MTDGTLIAVFPSYYEVGTVIGGQMVTLGSGTQAKIVVDLNGRKPPNTYGKDVFNYIYYISTPDIAGSEGIYSSKFNGKFMPEGFALSRNELSAKTGYWNFACNKQKTGQYCAALIMKDGWQIKDDYPWN